MAFKPTRKNLRPSRIGDLLKGFFEEKMPKTVGDEINVFGAWSKAVGADVSRQASPRSFRNGILFVETRHSMWTSELSARRHLIQRKINEALGKEVVRDIHFRVGRTTT